MSQSGHTDADRLDAVFETLSNQDRRRLLYYLREHGSATHTELVDVLTGWAATDSDDGMMTRADWERMQVDLHHVHLPKLREQNLVEYDPETDVVEIEDIPSWISRCLDVAFESEREMSAASEQLTEFVSDDQY